MGTSSQIAHGVISLFTLVLWMSIRVIGLDMSFTESFSYGMLQTDEAI